MDLRRHSQCHRRLFIAIVVTLLSNVCAMRNRETPMPSTAPSISETPSYLPSATPSFRPSLAPSSTPSTSPPSLSPSQGPTGQPTPSPSSAPTSEPTPSPSSAPSTSEALTTSPTTPSPSSPPSASEALTKSPANPSPSSPPSTLEALTKSPTNPSPSLPPSTSEALTTSPTTPSPSSPPSTSRAPTTEEEKLVSVAMPELEITFFLDDKDASSSSFLDLDTEVTNFLQHVLTGRSDENFEYLSLDYDVTQFTATADRRRLKSGVSVTIEGIALYAVDTASPTTGDIAELLKGYFSFWGIQDLENHLYATGLPSAQDVQVYIEGSIVEVVTNEEDPDGEDTDRIRGSDLTRGDSDDPTLEIGGIIGVVFGSLVLIIAISLGAFHGQKKLLKLNRQERRHSPSAVSEVSESVADTGTGLIGATPSPGGGYASSSDGVSTDDSLYTTDASLILSPNGMISPNSYDAKRLDKVIAAAKQSTADGKSSFV